MQKKSTNTGSNKVTHDYVASRPAFIAPVIDDEKLIDGVRYYFTGDNRMFIADVFDKMFHPPKGRIRTKFYKGHNPGLKIF